MLKILLAIAAVLVLIIVGFFFVNAREAAPVANNESPLATSTETWACNADAKICPDGSAVGRTGPACEFTACPSTNVNADTVSTYLGGSVTRFNLTINPREVISDSRCPQDVTCIWAGTVEVRTAVSTPTGHGEHIFTLGEPQVVGDFIVTLIDVTPLTKSDTTILEHEYRFTYEIKKV